MSVAESAPAGNGGEGPKFVCRSPGCISNSFLSDGATWLGAAPRQQSAPPEVLGAPPRREERPTLESSATWLGGSPAYEPEPPRRAVVRESAPNANGHEFEDGICLHCGRVERLAGRYGWSCPVRLP